MALSGIDNAFEKTLCGYEIRGPFLRESFGIQRYKNIFQQCL